MKIVVNYLNFVFHIEVKTRSNHIFEFCFSIYQKHETVLWVHGLGLTSFHIIIIFYDFIKSRKTNICVS